MGDIQDFAAKHQIPLIPADATSVEDLTHLFQESMTHFGGKVDFILHSIGMSLNVRKKRPYDDLDYDFLQKTLDISAISFHKVLQTAKKLDAINEWGSVVALSYVAAQRTMFEYNDMADAKAMLESIARSFGYIYGREKRIRVNTISQSPTMTTAGSGIKGFDSYVAPWKCYCRRMCQLLRLPVFRPYPEDYDAESLPRWRIFEYGYEL